MDALRGHAAIVGAEPSPIGRGELGRGGGSGVGGVGRVGGEEGGLDLQAVGGPVGRGRLG